MVGLASSLHVNSIMGVRMDRFLALVVVCLAAAGCGADGDNASLKDNHGFGWHFEAQGANGVILRNAPGVVAPVTVAVLADIYDQTQACTGLNAPGPFVIVVAEAVDGPGGNTIGRTYYQPPLVLITEGWSWIDTARHEFVHYLLDQAGFPRELNSAHHSPFFTDCVHSFPLLGLG
jgi:hypothetical protein